MTRREIIQNVLEGRRSERLPRALFGGGLWSFRQTGLKIEDITKDPGLFGEALAGLFVQLDTDIIFAGSGLNSFPAEAIGGEIAFREGQAPLLSHSVIQKAEDARHFEEIDINASPNSLALGEVIAVLRKRLSDRFLCATSWGPFTWGMILCDWNILQEKAATDRAFIREVCDLGVRLSWAFYKPLIDRGLIDGISIPDGAVTLIPADLYQDVIIPSERKLFDLAKQHGIKCFLHQCGKISPQIALYPETGADCVSIDTGASIGEAYAIYSGRLVTAGNVDVINTIFGGDPAGICKEVLACVSEIADPLQNYILMPSCDLPAETPLQNVREFLACANRVPLRSA